MKNGGLLLASAALVGSAGSAAFAQNRPIAAAQTQAIGADAEFNQFRPSDTPVSTKVDYAIWDEALEFFVFRMGRSIRESAPRVDAGLGTRRVFGHDSRYRLEGNRVLFSFLDDEVIASLTAYREDLQDTGNLIDIATLPRNEQLAFWINLHNVAVIEKIAQEYPIGEPSRIRLDDSDLPLDETRFITVSGVKMSPKDIRTKIVFPNWSNPKVLYGFFRGEIGGPSIQQDAFTAENVSELLNESADEFINSLRGTQKSGKTLDVSKVYEEARPFFFRDWEADMRAHLLTYSQTEVTKIIEETDTISANIYATDVSDLANGERDPNLSQVIQGDRPKGFGVAANIARLLGERGQKMQKIIRRSDVEGRVTIIDVGDLTKPREPDEVE